MVLQKRPRPQFLMTQSLRVKLEDGIKTVTFLGSRDLHESRYQETLGNVYDLTQAQDCEAVILDFTKIEHFPLVAISRMMALHSLIVRSRRRLVLCNIAPNIQEQINRHANGVFKIETTQEMATANLKLLRLHQAS